MRGHGELVYCDVCGHEIYPASKPCKNHRVVMRSRNGILTNRDIENLEHNPDCTVRLDETLDAECKRLFDIYSQL